MPLPFPVTKASLRGYSIAGGAGTFFLKRAAVLALMKKGRNAVDLEPSDYLGQTQIKVLVASEVSLQSSSYEVVEETPWDGTQSHLHELLHKWRPEADKWDAPIQVLIGQDIYTLSTWLDDGYEVVAGYYFPKMWRP